MDQLIGQTLNNRYRIVSMLGEGGMGAVFRAHDITLQRDVAFKVMHPHYARQSDFRERFVREARTAARMDHPGIVKVFDFGQDKDMLYIVMELIPGANLRKMLDDLQASNKWILLNEAILVVRQLCLALDYAHRQGILHRDIKPANLMLKPETTDGLPYRVILTDLGLVKLLEGQPLTQSSVSVGTPPYMSPEQALGQATDLRSDVYSLGILLYELAVGKLPFPIKTLTEAIRYHVQEPPPLPRSIRPDIPTALEQVILKAIAKEPGQRFANAGEFAAALQTTASLATEVVSVPTTLGEAVSLITQYRNEPVESRGPSILREFASPVDRRRDQIQILFKDKTSRTVAIQGDSLTIGRDPGCEIPLDDTQASRHHARVTFDGAAYRVVDLNSANGTYLANNKLLPGVAEIWQPEALLHIGDVWLRLLRADKTGSTLPTRSDGNRSDAKLLHTSPGAGWVGVSMQPAQLAVEPGSSCAVSVLLLNQGASVDQFTLALGGVPKNWVIHLPVDVSLMPGEQKEVTFAIQPPRTPRSRAGRHPIALSVTSRKDPTEVAAVKGVLTVSSYSQFKATLQPQKVRAGNTARLVIQNQGNLHETFTAHFEDRGDEVVFTPSRTQLRAPEGQSAMVDFQAKLRKSRWVGGEQIHPFNAEVGLSKGEPQIVNGEVVSRAIVPGWAIPILLFLCLIGIGGAAAVSWLLLPTPTPTQPSLPTVILTPTPTQPPLPTVTLTSEPGQPVFDEWCIYPQGQQPVELRGCPIQVIVTRGQKVMIQWKVQDADRVRLSPLGDRPLSGQEEYLPLETTSFTLQAFHQEKSHEETIQVIVEIPTATPTPTPVPTPTPTDTNTPAPTPTATDTRVPTPTDTPVTITVKCAGVKVGEFCWYFGKENLSCDEVCSSHGGYDEATRSYAGSDGSQANCKSVLTALKVTLDNFFETSQGGIGCFAIQTTSGNYFGYWDQQPTTGSATSVTPGRRRICACQK